MSHNKVPAEFKDALTDVYRQWLGNLSAADSKRVLLRTARKSYTAENILEEIEDETAFGAMLLHHLYSAQVEMRQKNEHSSVMALFPQRVLAAAASFR